MKLSRPPLVKDGLSGSNQSMPFFVGYASPACAYSHADRLHPTLVAVQTKYLTILHISITMVLILVNPNGGLL